MGNKLAVAQAQRATRLIFEGKSREWFERLVSQGQMTKDVCPITGWTFFADPRRRETFFFLFAPDSQFPVNPIFYHRELLRRDPTYVAACAEARRAAIRRKKE